MDNTQEISIIRCDYSNPRHCEAVVHLMKIYMTDAMGGSEPLSDRENKNLIKGLRELPTTITLLATCDGEFVGLTNSFVNFGTFAAKKFLNIHDVIVKKEFRGLKIGERLMEENIKTATELECAKVTLEVREDNIAAQKLYEKLGFSECNPSMYFWAKYL